MEWNKEFTWEDVGRITSGDTSYIKMFSEAVAERFQAAFGHLVSGYAIDSFQKSKYPVGGHFQARYFDNNMQQWVKGYISSTLNISWQTIPPIIEQLATKFVDTAGDSGFDAFQYEDYLTYGPQPAPAPRRFKYLSKKLKWYRWFPKEISALSDEGKSGQIARYIIVKSNNLRNPEYPDTSNVRLRAVTPSDEYENATHLFVYSNNRWKLNERQDVHPTIIKQPDALQPTQVHLRNGDYLHPDWLNMIRDMLNMMRVADLNHYLNNRQGAIETFVYDTYYRGPSLLTPSLTSDEADAKLQHDAQDIIRGNFGGGTGQETRSGYKWYHSVFGDERFGDVVLFYETPINRRAADDSWNPGGRGPASFASGWSLSKFESEVGFGHWPFGPNPNWKGLVKTLYLYLTPTANFYGKFDNCNVTGVNGVIGQNIPNLLVPPRTQAGDVYSFGTIGIPTFPQEPFGPNFTTGFNSSYDLLGNFEAGFKYSKNT